MRGAHFRTDMYEGGLYGLENFFKNSIKKPSPEGNGFNIDIKILFAAYGEEGS